MTMTILHKLNLNMQSNTGAKFANTDTNGAFGMTNFVG